MKNTIERISQIKIQGAEKIATAGLAHLKETALKSKVKSANLLSTELLIESHKLLGARPTEPMLFNLCNYVLAEEPSGTISTYKNHILSRILELKNKLETHKEYISHMTYGTLKSPCTIYTHCHSGTVTRALIDAKNKGKSISVYNTETRPLFQGRITAAELAKHGIPVKHHVDSAMRLAIKECDYVLIGCDAITPTAVINKIGSELACECAYRFGKPIYIVTHSLKFDPRSLHGNQTPIEDRDPKEVWDAAPRGVEIVNPAFEMINPSLIKGIISELGVHKHTNFIYEIQKEYPWINSRTRIK